MLKRLITTALVFATALLLLFAQNKCQWSLGYQELRADLRQDGSAWLVTFRDLASNRVEIGGDELAQLKHRLAGDDLRRDIPLVGEPVVTPDDSIRIEPKAGVDAQLLKERMTDEPFKRPNPTRPLFHIARGIDLRGGVEFICQLYNDNNVKVSADDEVVTILRSRLDQRGLTEPSVSRLSNGDVQVIIPGGTRADAARTRKVLETTGRLEFREVIATYDTPPGADLPEQVLLKNGKYDFAPGIRGSRQQIIAIDKTRGDERPTKFYHLGPAELTGKDVKDAGRTMDNGREAVSIQFSSSGAVKNGEFTRRLFADAQRDASGGHMAILFDGKVESDPVVRSPSTVNCIITGQFTPEEIESLRSALKGGSLAVTPVVLSERVVGATLGVEAVNRAITTMLATFLAVLVFMALYYRRLGLVAVLNMTVTAALTWAALSIFGATLTLPGLAGFVLSVAMSMDTNVLVYERIREELRGGKDLRSAIDRGYSGAFTAILDSNLTTIFSGLVLYWVGSGPVQGFGLTLCVGVAVSMFSGVYIGRLLADLFTMRRQTLSMANMVPELRLPYVGWRRVSYTLSFITGIIALGWFGFGHLIVGGSFNRNFDIDFTGGNLVQVTFAKELDADQVRESLGKAWQSSNERFDQLDPAELAAPQGYYSGLGSVGATRQWVLRGRDLGGAELETQRAKLDSERGAKQKRIDQARAKEQPDEAAARALEAELKPIGDEIRRLERAIADRTERFKAQIAEAFTGLVAPEGDEVAAASWTGTTLSLTLKTLQAPDANQLEDIRAVLARREELSEVKMTPSVSPVGYTVAATFRQAPASDQQLEVDVPLFAHLTGLLSASGTAPTDVGRLLVPAEDIYEAAITAGAGKGVVVAQPFPATQHFSGQVAGQMKLRALLALALATVAMLAYIAARFEFGFGVAAIFALAHDLLLTLGIISMIGIRIDLTVVAALLTVIGYSVNDTIVNFDRIRENLKKMSARPLGEIIDQSVAQTIPRTVLTGGATILAMIAMIIFAGPEIRPFNITLLLGTVLGTYSSVFVAAPMLLLFDRSKLVTPEPVEPVEPAEGDGEPPALGSGPGQEAPGPA
ncbi:MAG: protein translocase subunit SecD [Planctomycetes bacterium]|nr:protein translocase subunit SecD [Planctomycetota bacterium]